MTAEIAVLNKSAVALAADSAVSIRTHDGHKTFNTTNKLFALTKKQPVGIMVYGMAELNAIPWETLIKMYRAHLGHRSFRTIDAYQRDFISFLSHRSSVLKQGESEYFRSRAEACMVRIREKFLNKVEAVIEEKKSISTSESLTVLSSILQSELNVLRKSTLRDPAFRGKTAISLARKYRKKIEQLARQIFEEFSLTRNQTEVLLRLLGESFLRHIRDDSELISGVVIAGFGDDEHFPAFSHLLVEGSIGGILKYRRVQNTKITTDNPVLILPLAQSEVVETFMEGIDPALKNAIGGYLKNILVNLPASIIDAFKKDGIKIPRSYIGRLKTQSQEILGEVTASLGQYSDQNHVQPVCNATMALPKDELAAMAEALVNLTSFRRRVSMDAETVGGAVDVAVISKGDGLVWIKRKHYFKSELNPHFFERT